MVYTKKIFEPITINKTEFKNRLVVSAMVSNFCNEDGTASEQFIAYHETKAKGGWGIVITEDYAISPTAGAFKYLPALYDDFQMESHRKLTERVHAAGGKIVAQIYHAGRCSKSHLDGIQTVSSSPEKDQCQKTIPHELNKEEIAEIIEQFAVCAERVKKVGFDGVELHGAHGYLLHQFLSPYSNKRSDGYGGSLFNRARFALEVIRAVREKVGSDFPVFYRLSADEYIEGGLNIEETKAFAILLEEAGVDVIHCSQGSMVTKKESAIIPPYFVDKAKFINNAAELKKVVNIPVIGVGRVNNVFLAEEIVRSGKADLVTMARASLADPYLPNKALNGQYEDIRTCIGCVQGCSGRNGKWLPIRCMVNPDLGYEAEEFDTHVSVKKRIAVVGGGVSGLSFAYAAAKQGHEVIVFEKENKLGGQWLAAAVPVGKSEFTSLISWYELQLTKLQVTIRYNVNVTCEEILQNSPDVVIIATGSKPFIPPIKGIESEKVLLAQDVLLGRVDTKTSAIVIGGGLVGAETADWLASKNTKVTLVEMLSQIVKDGLPATSGHLQASLASNNVDVYTSAQVLEINEIGATVKLSDGSILNVEADNVIIASGMRSENKLYHDLKDVFSGEIMLLGDALTVKNGFENIQESYRSGLKV